MNDDSVLINPVTSDDLFKSLCDITPAFKTYWAKDDNYFKDDNGLGSLHGIFAEYSEFIKRYFDNMAEHDRIKLFNFVEDCVNQFPISESGISNAACTCFLENLAGEGTFSSSILKYLGMNSKVYFLKYNSCQN